MAYTIREMIEELTKLNDIQWGGYAFYHEPLERKFDGEQKTKYICKANICGSEEAKKVKKDYPGKPVLDITKELGVKVKKPKTPVGGGHVLFAQYAESGEITIFMDCIEKAETLIREEKLERYLSGLDLFEVLLAHELFHVIEHRRRKQIYTQTEKVELWRRPFSNKSRILCLSEMAAMAFAKEMMGINYSPYILDVLLMYSYNTEAACALYEEILEAAGMKERKEEC